MDPCVLPVISAMECTSSFHPTRKNQNALHELSSTWFYNSLIYVRIYTGIYYTEICKTMKLAYAITQTLMFHS